MSTLFDLDGDGYLDTAYPDSAYYDSGSYYDAGDPYLYADGVGLGGEMYGGLEAGGYGEPWGYDEGYYPDLWDYTSFVDHSVPLYDAWGDSSWESEQYALADLMYFQRQLEVDHALDESERIRRWEERLAWEQLDDEARALRYSELASMGALGTLGLAGGWWGRQYGGGQFDLSYLRDVPVQRELFSPSYRSSFTRFPTLARRYSPFFSPQRLRAFGGGGMPINPHPSVPYHSRQLSLSNGVGLSLREQELQSRLRVAEMRASLTSLSPAHRARALDDARRLRAQLNAESRATRTIDRAERRSDALLAAREAEAERAEMRDEAREQRGIARLEQAAGELMGAPMPAGFGGGYGVGSGRYY